MCLCPWVIQCYLPKCFATPSASVHQEHFVFLMKFVNHLSFWTSISEFGVVRLIFRKLQKTLVGFTITMLIAQVCKSIYHLTYERVLKNISSHHNLYWCMIIFSRLSMKLSFWASVCYSKHFLSVSYVIMAS